MAQPSIFVSIASYRDNQCQYTLRDLFEKARHPERVVAGVCFQVAPEDEDSFLLDLGKWASQVRTLFLDSKEAMGPCYARWLVQEELFQGEDYYFQIDSHFRFVQDWDEVCLSQLALCKSPKPLLTSYVSSYTLPKDYQPGEPDRAVLATGKRISIICADTFGDQNKDDPFLRIKTRTCRSDFGGTPPPASFWTARFAFSRGEVVREVPYDPHLEYIFFGEEISMAARLWTAGWDFFNPVPTIAYHLGSRAHRHWFREVQTSPEHVQKETAAKYRICGMLGTPWPDGRRHSAPAQPYGLGAARTLAEYEAFAGVDFGRMEVGERGRCGGVSPDLFPPQWAEEEREKIMQASQLQDVASWAGKDNKEALQRQFPDASPSPAAPPPSRVSEAEAERAREPLGMQIQMLQARLHSSGGEDAAVAELELSRAFAQLGQVDAAAGLAKRSGEACERALSHAQAASDRGGSDALWRGRVAQATAAAQVGLQSFAEAKAGLREALDLAAEALAEQGDGEQLAHDVVEGVHGAHERTDDRKGLENFIPGLRRLLKALRALPGNGDVAPLPIISATERPPEAGAEVGLRARLLERVALVCVATGREKDTALVERIFTDFRAARESPNLRRLLAMLQSSGALLGG